MPRPTVPAAIIPLLLTLLAASPSARKPAVQPPAHAPSSRASIAGFDLRRLERVDALINAAIAEQKLPGAVVLVGRGERTVYQKAYGRRAVTPQAEPMTLDTIFDLASLTKVVATATSVMILIEDGKIRLNDRVSTFIPDFARYGKDAITVRHLLTHVSGLRPDVDLAEPWEGEDTAIALAIEEVPVAAPGERFIYSDINFVVLGEIVRRISGQRLDAFARARIFDPLGMRETMFNPREPLLARVSPTDNLRGVVHDPTARRMGGVAGHAGLFGTAADLARFCRMILNGGSLGAARILSPLGVARMTSPATPPGERNMRGFGWDIDSVFSSNRGELLPVGSFGHTGFTGTSLWIDPSTGVYVVFLSNRLHPDGKGDVTPLRARVASAVAAAVVDVSQAATVSRRLRNPAGGDFGAASSPPPPARPSTLRTLTGIDVLRNEGFARLRGKRVGLVTNHTGLARDGTTTIDLLHGAKEVTLAALFAPEHGMRGILDANVPSTRDDKTGVTIHSLYGETQRPSPAMLDGLDVIVIDLQDVGSRFYTYMTTMAYVMEEAAKRKLQVVVLDRPNPVNGFQIEGPSLDRAPFGFTGYFSMPVRHGLTLGELARLFNGENKIGADLDVVSMQGWNREAWFDDTGLAWVNLSPNMRNLNQATLYPGIGAIETSNISVGRGTDTPFEQIGAPWIDGVRLAEELNARRLPGVRVYPVTFTPASSKYQNETCRGVFLVITDRVALRPVRVGLEIASALVRLHGDKYDFNSAERLIGSKDTITRVKAGEDPVAIASSWAQSEARWRLLRAKYLLY
jgi:uncharacterized protein YbbC (DUF1343 family)/CubicO group peptidase (beta-lactamase class C family)